MWTFSVTSQFWFEHYLKLLSSGLSLMFLINCNLCPLGRRRVVTPTFFLELPPNFAVQWVFMKPQRWTAPPINKSVAEKTLSCMTDVLIFVEEMIQQVNIRNMILETPLCHCQWVAFFLFPTWASLKDTVEIILIWCTLLSFLWLLAATNRLKFFFWLTVVYFCKTTNRSCIFFFMMLERRK